LRAHRRYLLADDPGLGKTAQALMALDVARPAIVTCRPGLRLQWAHEAKLWRPDLLVEVRTGTGLDAIRGASPGKLAIQGYSSHRAWARAPKGERPEVSPHTQWVVDEVQALKAPAAQQTRGCRRYRDAVIAAGGSIWGLSATPTLGKPWELWETLRSIGLEKAAWGSRKRFEGLFLEAIYGDRIPEQKLPEIERRLSRVQLRRSVDDALDLPDEVIRTRMVDISRTSEYADVEAISAELFRTGEEGSIEEAVEEAMCYSAGKSSTPFATLRRLLAMAKIHAMVDLQVEHEEAGAPLVVWSAHRAPVIAAGSRSGWGRILGGLDLGKRAEYVRRFSAGGLRGLACTIQAGGTGLDGLQRRCRHSVFVDRAWSPGTNRQARDRIRRIGSEGGCVIHTHLVADHDVDRAIDSILCRKALFLGQAGY